MKNFLSMFGILVLSVILTILINYAFESHSPEEGEIKLHYTGIYNGHSYLYFNNSHSWIHDPDCKKCLDRNPWKNIVFPEVEQYVPYILPAPGDTNSPPWIYTKYPVYTPEEMGKYLCDTTNYVVITTNHDKLNEARSNIFKGQWNLMNSLLLSDYVVIE